ncbi:MAG: HXXEE domain-containing protein [Anaerolineales bacterium]|nr:HXXEE domain-containing protein [Anaerolineales bacterium]
MIAIIHTLGSLSFMNLLWLFILSFIIHELEEWNIADFEHRNFINMPAASNTRNARGWIIFISLAAILWAAAGTLPGTPAAAAWVFLPAVILACGNALQHVYWSVYFRQYAPGLVTAVLLLLPLGSLLVWRYVQQEYAPLWYLMLWLGILGLNLAQTVIYGKRTLPLIHGIYKIGDWFAGKVLRINA